MNQEYFNLFWSCSWWSMVKADPTSSPPNAAYMRQWIGSALVQIMACRLFSTKPLYEPMLTLLNGTLRTNLSEILIKIKNFSFTKMNLKISSVKWRPFCPGGDELIR